jgi:hypothetical protein
VGSLLSLRPRKFIYACVLSALAVTAAIEMKDAIEIHRHARDYDYPLARALDYITKDAGHCYYIHDNIRDALARLGKLPLNATTNPGEADLVLTFPPIFPHDIENSPFVFKEWFGTREVNYRYYSTWQWRTYGMDRDKLNPIILDLGDARRFGLI